MFAINGQFFQDRLTGMERFSISILKELDKICKKGEFEIILPKGLNNIPIYKNIRVVQYGSIGGKLWTQTFFAFYTIIHKRVPLSLNSIVPILRPGIVCIHDITFRINKNFFYSGFRSKLSVWWRNFQYDICFKYCPKILTVSEFTKSEMLKYFKYDPNNIVVLGNGWDHIKTVEANTGLKDEHPEYFEKPYFFSLCSLAENKNLNWIIETAKLNKQYMFLIAGGAINKYGRNFNKSGFENIRFLGYIKDEEIKYLMKNCKAFIFPSLYEGFGIPPLEALSTGAEIIVSNVCSLPEIFGESAHYIDPHVYCNDLDALLSEQTNNHEYVLSKYTWFELTKKMYNELVKNK